MPSSVSPSAAYSAHSWLNRTTVSRFTMDHVAKTVWPPVFRFTSRRPLPPVLVACALMLASGAHAASLVEAQRIALPGVSGRIDHMAFDAAAGRVFVAALGNRSVEVVDIRNGRRVASLKGFEEPQGVLLVPPGNRLIVTDGARGDATVIDTATLRVLKRIPLRGDADNLRYDEAQKRIFIGAGSGRRGALLILDAVTFKLLGSIALPGHPESFQLESPGSRIFVNVPDAHAVVVVDGMLQRTLATWPIPARGNFPMALDESHHRLLIGTRSPARLFVLDTEDGDIVTKQATVGDTDDLFQDSMCRCVYVTGGGGFVDVLAQGDGDEYRSVEKHTVRRGARTSLWIADDARLIVAVPGDSQEPAQLRIFVHHAH